MNFSQRSYAMSFYTLGFPIFVRGIDYIITSLTEGQALRFKGLSPASCEALLLLTEFRCPVG